MRFIFGMTFLCLALADSENVAAAIIVSGILISEAIALGKEP